METWMRLLSLSKVISLETFLVEWKQVDGERPQQGGYRLETFLVEWKRRVQRNSSWGAAHLETFLVEWKRGVFNGFPESFKP